MPKKDSILWLLAIIVFPILGIILVKVLGIP